MADINPIEETLSPETLNEFLLVERIRKLRLKLYTVSPMPVERTISGTIDNPANFGPFDENQRILIPIASVEAHLDEKFQKGLGVFARSHRMGRDLAFSYNVDERELAEWKQTPIRQIGDRLTKMHRKMLYGIAHLIQEGR
jgi:hypothetical protein